MRPPKRAAVSADGGGRESAGGVCRPRGERASEIVLPYREDLSFQPGFFAGAVVGSLADFAAVSATYTLVPAGWRVATVDYDVKVIAPPAGERLIARGRVVKPGSTLLFGAAEVSVEKGGRGTLCAACLATARAAQMR